MKRFIFFVFSLMIFSHNQKPDLEMKVRLLYDGKVIFEGKNNPVDLSAQNGSEIVKAGGALSLTSNLQTGDYILQTIVKDNLAKKKKQIATQFVQFEIVD